MYYQTDPKFEAIQLLIGWSKKDNHIGPWTELLKILKMVNDSWRLLKTLNKLGEDLIQSSSLIEHN